MRSFMISVLVFTFMLCATLGINARSAGAPVAHAQTRQIPDSLLAQLPADATAIEAQLTSLNGVPYAVVTFDSPSGGHPYPKVVSMSSHELAPACCHNALVYVYDGQQWSPVYDLFDDVAETWCRVGTSPFFDAWSCSMGLDRIFVFGDDAPGVNLLVFQIGFSQSEANTIYGSFLLFLVPTDHGLWSGTLSLQRSGTVDRIRRDGNTITFEGVTYLSNDGLCCPSGYQRVTLTWTGDALVATGRCVAPADRFAALC